MSKMLPTRIQRLIEKEIKKSPVKLDYRFENGPKHRKLFIEGKMVMVFSHGACARKDIDKVKSLVRRKQDADHGRAVPRAEAKPLPRNPHGRAMAIPRPV